MKKTGKRVIAIALAIVMTLSVFTVGAVALTSMLTNANIRNKINKYSDPDTLSISKAEYIAVELAQELCFNEAPQICGQTEFYSKDRQKTLIS